MPRDATITRESAPWVRTSWGSGTPPAPSRTTPGETVALTAASVAEATPLNATVHDAARVRLGRESNTLHLVAGDLGTARDVWTDVMQRDTTDHGLPHARRDLVRQLDGYQPDAPAPRSVLGRRNPSPFGLTGLLGHTPRSGPRGPDLGH